MAEDVRSFSEPELERTIDSLDEDKEGKETGDGPFYCNNLMNLMNDCRKKNTLCDVTLVVEDVQFPAHKIVLSSASQFFHGLFNAEMKEKQQDRIELKEVKSSAMENLLEYIYTGKTNVNKVNAYELVKISSYFLVDGLKAEASSFISCCLNFNNALALKVFAQEHSCHSLEEACNKFIRKNFEEFVNFEDVSFFDQLEFKDIEELISNDSTVVYREETIFKTIKRWVMESPSTRKKHFKSLFQHIRLEYISKVYLNNVILKDKLVTGNASCMQFVLHSLSMADSLPPLSRPRASVDNHEDAIVIIGGFDQNNKSTSSVMCYIPSLGKDGWRALAPLSSARYACSSTFCGGFLYAIGGWEWKDRAESNAVNTIERYEPTTNSWLKVEPLLGEPEKWVVSATLAGRIYVMSTGAILCCYVPTTNSWECTSLPPNDGVLHGANLVACSNHLYLIGGVNGNDIVMSRLLEFDPGTEDWSLLSPMNTPRYLASAVAKRNKIYVIGGVEEYQFDAYMGEALGSCEVYDVKNDVWEMLPNLQCPRYAAGIACLWDDIYILGGEHEGETQDNVEHFNEEEKRWEVKTVMPPRSYFTCQWVRMPPNLSQLEVIKPESFEDF